MMSTKQIIVFFTLIAIVICADITLETLDIESLLGNEDQRKSVLACLMDNGPCGEFQELRNIIPVLVRTKCSKCTPKQRIKFDHISKVLLEKHPDIFNALVFKYSDRENPY